MMYYHCLYQCCCQYYRLLNPCGVLTEFPQRLKNEDGRGVRCANASNAVETLWKRCAIA